MSLRVRLNLAARLTLLLLQILKNDHEAIHGSSGSGKSTISRQFFGDIRKVEWDQFEPVSLSVDPVLFSTRELNCIQNLASIELTGSTTNTAQ